MAALLKLASEAGAQPRLQTTPIPAYAEDDQSLLVPTVEALETQVAALATEVAGINGAPTSAAPSAVEIASEHFGTPTSSVAGTPLAESGGAELLYYYFGKPGFSGRTPIYGEVRNTSSTLLHAPTLSITFYDSNNRLIDTAEADALISVLKPGETMPIEGVTDLAPGSWAVKNLNSETEAPRITSI